MRQMLPIYWSETFAIDVPNKKNHTSVTNSFFSIIYKWRHTSRPWDTIKSEKEIVNHTSIWDLILITFINSFVSVVY